MPKNDKKNVILRVSAYLLEHKLLFFSTLALACVMTILAVSIPRLIQGVLDDVFSHPSDYYSKLFSGILFIAFLFFTKELLNCFRIRLNNLLEQKVIYKLRSDIHQKILHLPISFFDKRKSGDISSRVIEDVQNLERAMLDGTEQGIIAILTLLGVTIMMFGQEPRLAFLVFLPLPILAIMAFRYAKISKKNWKSVREAAGDLNSLLVEDIQGNRVIHSFSLAKNEKQRFGILGEKLKARSLKAMYRWSIQGPSASFISSLGILAVVGYGSYLLQSDQNFTTGKFFAFMLYANMFYDPVRQLVSINNLISSGKASGERVFEILDEPITINDPTISCSFPLKDHSISFRNVEFSYGHRGLVTNDLNFDIRHGSTTALVGPTGAGKSTIANLLLRYYEVSKGNVSIGGVNIRNFKLEDLRNKIGFVSQDPFLFDATIKENLLLASPNADDQDIDTALKTANALDFVKNLPLGFDTRIGERGIRLSAGEKQRLTLARAILKSPPIMIFDEATSSVDVETEREIQIALSKIIKNHTTMIIAHRLSTIREADQIIFLDKGEIVEQGTHDFLISKSGKYHSFCKYQSNMIL